MLNLKKVIRIVAASLLNLDLCWVKLDIFCKQFFLKWEQENIILRVIKKYIRIHFCIIKLYPHDIKPPLFCTVIVHEASQRELKKYIKKVYIQIHIYKK